MYPFSQTQIHLFRSLFKGREDAFAVRWEKDGKKGYIPAYDMDWDQYKIHKASGGTLKNFEHKTYSKLSDVRIVNHLAGKETIGLYPLLSDNTSWFIVADFDENAFSKKDWLEECRMFLNKCVSHHIPAYLERSRSGKGGHVWIFFENNYPAEKSRKIMLRLLEDADIISPLDKNSNYDRIFPNQDVHSGKGLGNLVALPLQGNALEQQNSCFIDPSEKSSHLNVKDQWQFLQQIQRVTTEHLDEVFQTLFAEMANSSAADHLNLNKELQVILDNRITIHANQLAPALVQFLRDNLNFINSEYVIKKRLGKKTYGIEP